MILEKTYVYVPLNGDPDLPVEIHGFAPYVPGRRRVVDRFAFRTPAGSPYSGLDRLVVRDWPEVVAKILETFPGETEAGFVERSNTPIPFGSCLP